MATSHYCNGKWRSGTVAECHRHRPLDMKQSTVYNRSTESGSNNASDSGESSGSGEASSGSTKAAASSSDKS